jgi:hypothetical protein
MSQAVSFQFYILATLACTVTLYSAWQITLSEANCLQFVVNST